MDTRGKREREWECHGMPTNELQRQCIETMHSWKRLHRRSIPIGFTRQDFAFLRTIDDFHMQHPDAVGIYVNDLAEMRQVSKSAASKMLQNLEQRGLIERVVDPNNRRKTFVRMTPKGHRFGRHQRESVDAFLQRVADRIGEQRMCEILAGIRELSEAMMEELESLQNDNRPQEETEETQCDPFSKT